MAWRGEETFEILERLCLFISLIDRATLYCHCSSAALTLHPHTSSGNHLPRSNQPRRMLRLWTVLIGAAGRCACGSAADEQ
jgi:hypothetical protein